RRTEWLGLRGRPESAIYYQNLSICPISPGRAAAPAVGASRWRRVERDRVVGALRAQLGIQLRDALRSPPREALQPHELVPTQAAISPIRSPDLPAAGATAGSSGRGPWQ